MRVIPPQPVRALALAVSLLVPELASAEVRHVDASASGAADGSSWQDAFPGLQAALAVAQPGDEIWVAAGVYTPSASDATASFVMRDGVALYGGFDGTETALALRDWVANETHLSGDIGQDDVVGSGLGWYLNWNIHTANAGHVVRAEGVGTDAVLDGFTVENGALGPTGTIAGDELMFGSGLYAVNADPTIRHCTFRHNEAAFASGGGVYLLDSNAVLEDCRFLENYAHLGNGAGLMSYGTSRPVIARCEFARNVAVAGSGEASGGGLCHYGSEPIEVDACVFEDNQTRQFYSVSSYATYGGGLFSFASGITVRNSVFRRNRSQLGGGMITCGPSLVENCLFERNEAFPVPNDPFPEVGGQGGALMVHSFQAVEMRAVGCTFVNNKAKKYAAVYGGWNASARIEDSVVWGNVATNPEVQGGYKAHLGGSFTCAYTCCEGIFDPSAPGEDPIEPSKLPGCIDVEPQFVAPGSFFVDGDFRLAAGSPCVDAGSNALLSTGALLDVAGGGRLQDDLAAVDTGVGTAPIVDMGCLERLADALTADRGLLSLAAGGQQALALNAGAAHAGEGYWVVGSLAGTWPGFSQGGVHLPLNPDAYFNLTLTGANHGHLIGTLGMLDASGAASAAIALPAGSPASWAGLALDHAFVAFTGVTPTFAGGSVPLVLQP